MSTPAVVRVSQYDVGRPLVFKVYDGTSPADLTGVTAVIEGTKRSGLGFSESGTVSDNTVTLDTTIAMTQEYGSIPAEIRFSKTGEDVGTANFILAVEKSPHLEGTTDGTQETMANLETRLNAKIATQAELDEDILVFKNSVGVTLFSADLSEMTPSSYGNIVLSKNTMTILEEESDTLTVSLSEAPSANQTVYLAVSDASKISVSPSMLVFTSGNWNTPQTVTVTALADADSDDESETVTFTSRRVEAKILAVTITDTTPEKVTSGLQLEFDFRNLEAEATTVVDTVNGVTLQNLDTAYFNKVANGIYGSSNTKYASFLTSGDAWTAFKTAMANADTTGFTFEVFGTRMPNTFDTGNAKFLNTKSAMGYSATPNANSAPGGNPSKMPYIDTNDSSQSATWSANSAFDNGTSNGYITVDQQDFLQADVVFNANGTVDLYYNGYKNRTSFAAPANFASWDLEKAFTPTNTYFLGAQQLGSSSDSYLTFIRIYSKPLSSSEVAQNISYNKQVLGISNFQ